MSLQVGTATTNAAFNTMIQDNIKGISFLTEKMDASDCLLRDVNVTLIRRIVDLEDSIKMITQEKLAVDIETEEIDEEGNITKIVNRKDLKTYALEKFEQVSDQMLKTLEPLGQ